MSTTDLRAFLLSPNRPDYLAKPSWYNCCSWAPKNPQSPPYHDGVPLGDECLVVNTSQYNSNLRAKPATATIVAIVNSDHSRLSPLGDFDGQRPLKDSKYHLALHWPPNKHSVFAIDYANAIQNVNRMLQNFSNTSERSALMMRNHIPSGLHLTANVFHPQIDPNDDEISYLPIPSAYRDELLSLSRSHQVLPFPVLDRHGYPVPPSNVANFLSGALVEVTFSLHHTTNICPLPPFFYGRVLHVRVLRRGD